MSPRRPSRRLAAAWLREVGVSWYLPSPAGAVPADGCRAGGKGDPPGADAAGGADTEGGPAAGAPPGGTDGVAGASTPAEAAALASASATLEALRAEALACRACPLRRGARQVVFGVGNPRPRLLLVGEGPGEDEDRQGEPFVGRAGKLLDKWIARLGLSRGDVYIANVVKCRPPGNRAPEPPEAEACLPWLRAQLRLLRPEVVCTLGNTPLRQLLGVPEGITRARGKWLSCEGVPALPTYHPAYVLRNPRAEAEAFADFDALAARLAGG